jgi:large subunit ribosomal protein L7/L12
MVTKEDILDAIGNMTVCDLVELTGALKKRFNITSIHTTSEIKVLSEENEDQTEFTVILQGISDSSKKIPVLKLVRELTGLGLKESKDLVDNIPSTLKELIPKSDALIMKGRLEAQGAVIELK